LMLPTKIGGGVNGLIAEILEDHIRLHMMNPDQEMESPEECFGAERKKTARSPRSRP
jgi:hypothetical protein